MPTYYVFIPGNEQVTAEVNAPSTKHARTTLLDYLARRGFISYSDRGRLRREVKTVRVEPGSTDATIKLSYKYETEEEPEVELELPESALIESIEEEPTGLGNNEVEYEPKQLATQWSVPVKKTVAPIKPQVRPQEGPVGRQPVETSRDAVKEIFGSSPIIDLSRRSQGL